ncbi:hypothetical protein GOODEAATRI_002846 [Goodea atripinnis]|uniref:Uncharacterized protein n=1 Tax=Goodea atripinnis TaxID=208336 RepID=A0ABV0NAM9_9TELE
MGTVSELCVSSLHTFLCPAVKTPPGFPLGAFKQFVVMTAAALLLGCGDSADRVCTGREQGAYSAQTPGSVEDTDPYGGSNKADSSTEPLGISVRSACCRGAYGTPVMSVAAGYFTLVIST